ncbi:MAG: carbamoyltransferase family protein [Pseudonocardiaceae bacterium]
MSSWWPLHFHDAAAILLRDGQVIADIEQERLNRVKHTTAFAHNAIEVCLDGGGVSLRDIDRVAFFFSEPYLDRELYKLYAEQPDLALRSGRELLADRLGDHFGLDLPDDAVAFVPHHTAHAYSAYPQSGYHDALVVVLDGAGEHEALSVYTARGAEMELLTTHPISASLGYFYLAGTQFLGYSLGDEYKVMGLAPHGDPTRYRRAFRSLYDLRADGEFQLNQADLHATFAQLGFPLRRRGEQFSQLHKDFAAGLQEVLENIALHVLCHWQRTTGHRRVAIAGGVAQNCTLNGKLLRQKIFDDVFVHPAAHDAGAALGAALKVHLECGGVLPRERIRHLFWGADLPDSQRIEGLLDQWARFVTVERCDHIERDTARLIAAGQVIGWVQGRAEFGPRALGHRSILADPRPETNRDRVNKMVKQRETYRPFAPSVQAEHIHEYFHFPDAVPLPDFMVFTAPVRTDKQALLGAVTHVDGTARIHAVDRAVNPRFWRLLEEFRAITEVPVLLNTSFNNHAEPIVDSVEDALCCYLTTQIDHLVIDDMIVSKRAWNDDDLGELAPALLPAARLRTEHTGGHRPRHRIAFTYRGGADREIDAATYEALVRADGRTPLWKLSAGPGHDRIIDCVRELWSERYLILRPVS